MNVKNRTLSVSGIRRMLTEFAENRHYRNEYRRLEQMPDYVLSDIGLTRGEIRAARRRRRG